MGKYFDIDHIFFTVLGYSMSYIEFFATLAGAVGVYMSAKANVWNWPVGLINVTLSFFLFYQVQLYPDMFLQVFYFVTALVGWYRWTHPKPVEEDEKHELRVTLMKPVNFLLLGVAGIAGTILLGSIAENLHSIFPQVFSLPSAYPYADSFVTVMSIVTTFAIIHKKLEGWILWIVIDAVAAYLYFMKDIKFIALEYVVFCFLAAFGLWNWLREYRSYSIKNA